MTRIAKGLLGAAAVLCLFGLYESVDAAISAVRTTDRPALGIFDYPAWGLAHFVPGVLFMTLTPLQLWASFRNRHRTLHRWAGRLLAVCGLFLGVSGVAFIVLLPDRPLQERAFMLTFFSAFLFFLFKAVAAARRRDFATHRAWMIRWFCTGLTITTQRLLLIVFIVAVGFENNDQFWDLFVTAGWLGWALQIAIGEWWIQRRAVAGARRAVAAA